MSSFIAAALATMIHRPDDFRHCDEYFWGTSDLLSRKPEWDPTWQDDDGTRGYAGAWWPNSSNLFGGWGNGLDGDILQNIPAMWGDYWDKSGANGRLAFVGYTRNQYGSAEANCTVRCYRVSTDELVSKVTSDANGLYFATTPYSDAHFLVIHSSGGTLAGATKDSLLPA